MKKKLSIAALFCVIALQLAAVTGFIAYFLQLDQVILEKGVELRFRVTLISVDEDGVITFRPEDYWYYDGQVEQPVYIGNDGFAYSSYSKAHDIIASGDPDYYIRVDLPNAFPQCATYDSGNAALYEGQSGRYGHAKYLEEYYRGSPYDRDENAPETRQPEAYVTVALYRGHAEVTGLYIAGAAARPLSALPEPVPAEDPTDAAS